MDYRMGTFMSWITNIKTGVWTINKKEELNNKELIKERFEHLFKNEIVRECNDCRHFMVGIYRFIGTFNLFVNVQKNYYNKEDVFNYIGKYSKQIKEIVIWEKTNPMPASGNSITNSYEFFIVLGDKPLKSNTTYTKNIIHTSVNSNMPKEHKAVMKPEVSDWFIENFTEENDIVLDCFMGLGTTGKSCLKNNRSFIGIEINENYFNIAKNDIESMINN